MARTYITGALYKAADKDGESYEWVPNPVETPKTGANWPITPRVFYWAPKFLYERYHKPVMITENGMSCHDAVSLDGQVHDPNRIDFYPSLSAGAEAGGGGWRGYPGLYALDSDGQF